MHRNPLHFFDLIELDEQRSHRFRNRCVECIADRKPNHPRFRGARQFIVNCDRLRRDVQFKMDEAVFQYVPTRVSRIRYGAIDTAWPWAIVPYVSRCNTAEMPRLSPCLASRWHEFFTVNLLQPHGNDLLARHIILLREIVASVQSRHPFCIHGWVV